MNSVWLSVYPSSALEITPEIACKNTSNPAMSVYLPDNSAGRNEWLLFVTYLFGRKYLTLSAESCAKLSSDSILASAYCHERHFFSSTGKWINRLYPYND